MLNKVININNMLKFKIKMINQVPSKDDIDK